MSKFATLMREILDNSNHAQISIAQAIETLKRYIELEELRIKKDVLFNIELSKDISKENILIPSMMIQPFIENSIWHGLKNQDQPEIRLKFNIEDEYLYIIIADNGTGFDTKLLDIKRVNPRGVNLVKERLASLRKRTKLSKVGISVESNKNGTSVSIIVPLLNAYENE